MTLPTLTPGSRETTPQRVASSAADALFTEHGVAPVTMQQIADRAGLTMTELTDAYPTKRALVVAVLQRWHGAWRRALTHITDISDDPRDEVLAIFDYLETCFADEGWRGCAFINGHAELGRQDPDIAALAQAHFLDVERHLTLVCERGGMPAHIAQGLTLLIEGARVESAVQRSAQPARAAKLTAAMLMSVYDQQPSF
ncbi:TetR/AcrR family transcriptional regulator [Curtobacterium citreum]|uniref:TetR/AcrR family transcriptional regulator n=1 Tax=Curtobacterium citreum TaxID=2036 RepID=UPI0025509FC4|nr:TetR/AcrR family transcriptional regulator [Curtobacterium citreum]MDK8172158.1 TetR/AcrR family transcriptional regulator [Curtobacterium citreum]